MLESKEEFRNIPFQNHIQTLAWKNELHIGKKIIVHFYNTIAHLDRVIVGPEGEMVPPTQWRVFCPHVHLEVLEEVQVLKI